MELLDERRHVAITDKRGQRVFLFVICMHAQSDCDEPEGKI